MSESPAPPSASRVKASMEWLDHIAPIQLLRALWDALFPKRFERIVLESVDGTGRRIPWDSVSR